MGADRSGGILGGLAILALRSKLLTLLNDTFPVIAFSRRASRWGMPRSEVRQGGAADKEYAMTQSASDRHLA